MCQRLATEKRRVRTQGLAARQQGNEHLAIPVIHIIIVIITPPHR